MGKRTWTEEEEKKLEELYKEGIKMSEIAMMLGKTYGGVRHKSTKMKLGEKYMRSNNINFKAVYQDYDWCFERFINRGMSHQEMADECGASLRVIQKWCSEIHRINDWTFRSLKKITDLQRQVMMFGRLGDGHIDRRPNQPMYIESHAEDEKDYLFWKYDILKDLCNQEPAYYKASYSNFSTNGCYLCKPTYRLNTKILDDLYPIREMTKSDIIKELNELGLSLHLLDDGNRDNLWHICLAEWTEDEKQLYMNVCKERFGLNCCLNKDVRYAYFDADSSRKIDALILNNVPNNLDIIHKKILDNTKITEPANYKFVILEDGSEIGLSTYCRKHCECDYWKTKDKMELLNTDKLMYSELELKKAV